MLSPKKERKLKRIEVQTKAYEDLNQLLASLREEFKQNNSHLQALCKQLDAKPAAELIRMDGCVSLDHIFYFFQTALFILKLQCLNLS